MDKKELTFFEKSLAVAPVVLAGLALFGQGSPDWVRFVAIVIALLLAVGWLLAEAGWLGKAIKTKFFRTKLSKEQAVRLSVLLDEISNHMSYSYTYSPFYVWHSCSNEHSGKMRMNYNYHGAIQNWLHDLRGKFDDTRNNTVMLVSSLSKAISEAARLAEQVERELHDLLLQNDLSEDSKKKIQREWDLVRGHFNQWTDKWQLLFKEIEKTTKTGGTYYIRPLGMIS